MNHVNLHGAREPKRMYDLSYEIPQSLHGCCEQGLGGPCELAYDFPMV
ncbi:MAG: hypothetical protein IJ037_02315 [Clostridia bacterium]|nr:hypothetical protein [Clostridia bacterium]